MNADEVLISVEPWVSGTRSECYWGPVSVQLTVPHAEIEFSVDRLLAMLCESLAAKGMNALLGLEIHIDPFAENEACHLEAVGTGALLAPIFGGPHAI